MVAFQNIFHLSIASQLKELIENINFLSTTDIFIFDHTRLHPFKFSTHFFPKYRSQFCPLSTIKSISWNYSCNESKLIIFPFSFSQTVPETYSILIDILKTFSYAILIDYRVPERNLDIPSFLINYGLLFCTSRKGFSCFHKFIKKNAIEGIIDSYSLNCTFRKSICAGTITILLIQQMDKCYSKNEAFFISAESGTTVGPGIRSDSG